VHTLSTLAYGSAQKATDDEDKDSSVKNAQVWIFFQRKILLLNPIVTYFLSTSSTNTLHAYLLTTSLLQKSLRQVLVFYRLDFAWAL